MLAAFVLVAVFVFGGCFNLGGGGTTTDTTSKVYETNEYAIKIPREWEVIGKNEFTSEVPPETDVVFRNNVKNETFTANVVIVKNTLQENLPTLEYAKRVYNRQQSGLYDFKEVKKDPFKIKIGGKEEETFFLRFEARKSLDEQPVRYFQTYAVKGNNAYIITGGTSLQENEATAKLIEDTVKSFVLK